MHKEYGKLTFAQFKRLLSVMPELDQARKELSETLRSDVDHAAALFCGTVRWAALYERPIEDHLAAFALVAGIKDIVLAAVSADDPQQINGPGSHGPL